MPLMQLFNFKLSTALQANLLRRGIYEAGLRGASQPTVKTVGYGP